MFSLIKKTSRFVFSAQHDILSSALTLSAMFAISRLFGILRYRTFATYFTRAELDIFFAAFRIPDFVFDVVISGALSAAFIPIYIKYSSKESRLSESISTLINCIMGLLFIFVLIMVVFARPINALILPGYKNDLATFNQIVWFSQILIITQLPLLVMGSLLSGIAQANKFFLATTASPLFYNLTIILSTILLAPKFGLLAPLIGVSVGALLYTALQIPILFKTDFHYKIALEIPIIKEFTHLFVPRVLAVITSQIDITMDLFLATLLEKGSFTIFLFAQNLQMVPVSLVGLAFGQASLPYLSEMFNKKNLSEAKKLVTTSLLQLLFLSVPLSMMLIFAQTPIVRIVFGGKKFDWLGTNYTADTLMYFAFAIPFHTIFYFLTRAFYSMHDTKTPLFINLLSVGINVSLSAYAILIAKQPVWALSRAFAVAIIINVVLLIILLYKKLGDVKNDKFTSSHLIMQTCKIYLASILSAPLPYALMKLVDPLLIDTTKTLNVLFLLIITLGSYSCIYLFLSWSMGLEQIYLVGGIITRFKSASKKVGELFVDLGE